MNIQRIKKIAKSIKERQFSKQFSRKNFQQSSQQMLEKINDLEQKHDSLLTDSMLLVDLLDQTINQNSQQYDILAQELERQKNERKVECKQFQDNIQISDYKFNEFRRIISEKEQEIMNLKLQIEERDHQICQIQNQNRQKISKLIQNFDTKLSEQLNQQKQEYQHQIITIKTDLQEQIKKHETGYSLLLNKNQLLADRLQQIMKYVKQVEQEQRHIEDELSPRMICNFSPKSSKKIEELEEFSSSGSSPNKSAQNLIRQELLSSRSGSNRGGNILREILNTQDRKSNNFGASFYSKQKIYLHISNDENNMNTLNIGSKSQQKHSKNAQPSLRKIQQFNAGEGNQCSLNPYYTFFTIICQCAKINSDNLEIAAAMDLTGEWNNLTEKRIPLHQWYFEISSKISKQIKK